MPYSAATGALLAAYLQERRALSAARGPLFLSLSDRNRAAPIPLWTWSKPATTLQYIHLCGRDLAPKLAGGMAHIHAWRVAQLGTPEGDAE